MEEIDRKSIELRYITGKETLKAISQDTGLPVKRLERWCAEGDWVKRREQAEAEAMENALRMHVSRRSLQLEKEITMLEDLCSLPNRLIDARGNVISAVLDGKRTRAFRELSEALCDLLRCRMTVDEIMTKPEKERIAIEKRRMRLMEKQTEKHDEKSVIEVVMGEEAKAMFE